MGNIHTVGPNKALVISGGCCGSETKRTIIGGWGWAWWFVTDVQEISLELMTLNPICENVETSLGVPITVTGVAQCKIITSDVILRHACEQFLGKSVKDIKDVILQTLEGHLRAILGTLTVEEIYQDRDQFATLVRDMASPDVGRMGIEILSFTIKDVNDNVEYLLSLGRAQTACVKRDADIGVVEANRDAGIREAECEQIRMDAKYSADTLIANANREYKMRKAGFDVEVNALKAESELAYELQVAKEKQKIRSEEIEITVVERKKQIEVEEKEIIRREKELISTVRSPALVEAYKVEQIAEANRTKIIELATASSERIKLLGTSNASKIELVGKAEAEQMRLKAQAFKKYDKAATLALVLEAMPLIAAEIAQPLAKTDSIVLLGDDRTTSEISKLLCNLPPAIQALSGVDISKVISKIPGAKV